MRVLVTEADANAADPRYRCDALVVPFPGSFAARVRDALELVLLMACVDPAAFDADVRAYLKPLGHKQQPRIQWGDVSMHVDAALSVWVSVPDDLYVLKQLTTYMVSAFRSLGYNTARDSVLAVARERAIEVPPPLLEEDDAFHVEVKAAFTMNGPASTILEMAARLDQDNDLHRQRGWSSAFYWVAISVDDAWREHANLKSLVDSGRVRWTHVPPSLAWDRIDSPDTQAVGVSQHRGDGRSRHDDGE